MAFVLVKNHHQQKGVLVLKHLEIDYFNSLSPKLINRLKEKYLIGLYFGFYYTLRKDVPNVDFYLAEDNVIEFINFDSSTPRCNLNGYNFIDNEMFEISCEEKITDLIYIGNSSRRKNLKSFLRVLGNLEKREIFPSVIIINVFRPSLDEFIELLKIRLNLHRLKNINLSYFEINNKWGRLISKNVISKLMKSSKYLVLTSKSEGAARVVAEAILSGLGVISYGYMKGGTNNHLDECDFIYHNDNELEESILSSLKVSHSTVNKNHKKFNQNNSKKILLDFIEYNFNNQISKTFHKEILATNLSNSFQSHNTILDRSIPTNNKTDECLSIESIYKLCCFLLNEKISLTKIQIFKVKDFFIGINKFTLKLLRFATKNIISVR